MTTDRHGGDRSRSASQPQDNSSAPPPDDSAAREWPRANGGGLIGPLRHRLFLLFAGVLLPSILLGAFQAAVVYNEYADRIRQTVREFAVLASSLDRSLLAQSEQILSAAAADATVRAVSAGDAKAELACAGTLAQVIRPFAVYAGLTLYDRSGASHCRPDPSEPDFNVADWPWFQDVLRTGQSGSSGYLKLGRSQEPGLVLTHPFINGGGDLVGVLALGIRLQFLPAITDQAGVPPESVVYLLDQYGSVLAGFDTADGNGSGIPDETILHGVANGALTEFTSAGQDGVERLYAVSAMPFYDLYVLFGLPKAQMLDPIWWKVASQVLVVVAAWLVAMIAVLPGARWVVTRWTDRLIDAARAMGRGDLTARADLDRAPDEFKVLGATLAGLAARIDRREAELRTALVQQKTMLREVHHRVKNNLQTVTSLLNLHAKGPRADPARRIFTDVQMRINALALVHRHLYESEDMRIVLLRPFLTNLCKLVQDGSGVSPRQVSLSVAIDEIGVPGEMAVPIALLVTEVLTNSFKHAFPGGRPGRIDVRLSTDDDGMTSLVIADDGIGAGEASADANGSPDSGMGYSLIGAFAKQLAGELAFSGPPGTTMSVRFQARRAASIPDEATRILAEVG